MITKTGHAACAEKLAITGATPKAMEQAALLFAAGQSDSVQAPERVIPLLQAESQTGCTLCCVLDANQPKASVRAALSLEERSGATSYLLPAGQPGAEWLADTLHRLCSLEVRQIAAISQCTLQNRTLYLLGTPAQLTSVRSAPLLSFQKKPVLLSRKAWWTGLFSLFCFVLAGAVLSVPVCWAGALVAEFFSACLSGLSPAWLRRFFIGPLGICSAPFRYGCGYLLPYGFALCCFFCFWKQKGISLRGRQIQSFLADSWRCFAGWFFRMEPLLIGSAFLLGIISVFLP